MRVWDLGLNTLLIGLENVLCIDYDSQEISRVVVSAVSRMQDKIGTAITPSLDEVIAHPPSEISGKMAMTIKGDIENQLQAFSLFYICSMFKKEYPFHLKQMNWLGFDREMVKLMLAFPVHEQYYETKDKYWDVLIGQADVLTDGPVKRILTVMAVLDTIGVKEGVCLMSSYLYASSAFVA